MSKLTLQVDLIGPIDKIMALYRDMQATAAGSGVGAEFRLTGQVSIDEVIRVGITVTVDTPLSEFIPRVVEYERPRNCLMRARIDTVGELVSKTADDLLALANFGQKSLDLVTALLEANGLALRTGR